MFYLTEKKEKTINKSTKEVAKGAQQGIKEVKKESKKSKRMIKISFTGRELLEGRIFDTTQAEEAKKENAFDPDRKYEPMTIILGENEMLPKVEEALSGMKEGEKKTVKLTSVESFGDRNSKFVVVMPLKSFIDQKINPVPGLIIRGEINGTVQAGKVQSVSGGRVRVDFNHPLAGREIEYEVKIEKEVKGKKEVGEALYDKYYGKLSGAKKELKGDDLYITLPKDAADNLKQVNPIIVELGKDLGIKITFKEEKGKDSKSAEKGKKKEDKAKN